MTFDLYGEGTTTAEELLDVAAHNLVPIYKMMNHTWWKDTIPDEAEIRTVLEDLWRDLKESMRYAEESGKDLPFTGFISTGGITMTPSFNKEGKLDDLKITYELGSIWNVAKARGLGFTK